MRVYGFLKNPKKLLLSLGYRGFFKWMSDDKYLKMIYKAETKQELDLNHPKTFNEKLQWMKLNHNAEQYTSYVDKVKVRDIITEKIGSQHLIPLLGVYDDVEEIDFDALPQQFVLKCTHDSGGVIVCRDKDTLDKKWAIRKLKKRLQRNYYWAGREKSYKNIEPRVIVESYMVNQKDQELKDYKFFCFDGEPKFLYVASGREKGKTTFTFYDMNYDMMPFSQYYPNSRKAQAKPEAFEEMKKIARVLSADFKHVRIDLYEVNGKIYFGEYTFYHFSGFREFEPKEYDGILGDLIKLS